MQHWLSVVMCVVTLLFAMVVAQDPAALKKAREEAARKIKEMEEAKVGGSLDSFCKGFQLITHDIIDTYRRRAIMEYVTLPAPGVRFLFVYRFC